MTPIGKLLLIAVGVFVFVQFVMGDATDRLMSYADSSKEPANAGPRGSVSTKPKRDYRKALSFTATVKATQMGDPIVYDTVAPACEAAGGGFIVISWDRGDDAKVAGTGSPSCHRGGKGDGFGALDIQPKPVNGKIPWGRLDRLDTELRQTPGIGELIWRGDDAHDVKLGADPPHLHVAVNCT